jgi:hypothetical protein
VLLPVIWGGETRWQSQIRQQHTERIRAKCMTRSPGNTRCVNASSEACFIFFCTRFWRDTFWQLSMGRAHDSSEYRPVAISEGKIRLGHGPLDESGQSIDHAVASTEDDESAS